MRARALVLVPLLAFACASPPLRSHLDHDRAEGPAAAGAVPVIAIDWERQPAVLAVAGDGPAEVPVSLTAGDGTGLAIVAMRADAVVQDPLAFTELHLTFRNPDDRAIEGRFEITLPPGAAVSRFAVRQGDGWQEGEVVELEAARAAYEDFLHRKVDPALLEKQAGNRFQARVFPIPALGTKEIIFSYAQELPRADDPYKLHLRGLPELGSLDVRVLYDEPGGAGLSRKAYELHRTAFRPDRDLSIPLPAASAHGLRDGQIALARITPIREVAKEPVESLIVLFDTSASRALGFPRQVARLGELIAAVGASAGAAMPLAVVAFDQGAETIFRGQARDFGADELARLVARKALGASDLGQALRAAAQVQAPGGGRYARALLVTDGIATAGDLEAQGLMDDLAGLGRAGVGRIDALVDGGIRDEALLGELVRKGLARSGVVLEAAEPVAQLAHRLGSATAPSVRIGVEGSLWSWPKVLTGVQPGDQVIVYAALPEGKAFEIDVGRGDRQERQSVQVAPADHALLERAGVSAQIRRFLAERGATSDERARESLKQEVIALSTRYRVLSDFTGLLVLETEDDYARFGIDRRALADIMTVGPSGLEMLDRKPRVQAVAAEAPPEPESGDALRQKDKGDRAELEKDSAAEKKQSTASAAPAAPPPPPAAGAAPQIEPRTPGDREDPRAPQGAPRAASRPAPRPAAAAPAKIADADGLEAAKPEAAPTATAAPRAPVARTPVARGPVAGGGSSLPSAPPREEADFGGDASDLASGRDGEPRRRAQDEDDDAGGPGAAPYEGKLRDVMALLAQKRPKEALAIASRWRDDEPGDALALIALGEALEALGRLDDAARAYGSLIDLFPSRADLRRYAGARLERLGAGALDLVIDTFRQAVAQRPDHPASHRLLAYALLRAGRPDEAFEAIMAGLGRRYPSGRFEGVPWVMLDDAGILAAAWLKKDPSRRGAVASRLAALGGKVATRPSLRFVLSWETDANDVDFHIRDGRRGHAFYSQPVLRSGGELYADVTTGYGPECFAIDGKAFAYPYRLAAHYYARGPMGYGMGKLQIVEHDGKGGVELDERPFVVMTDQAFIDLGVVKGPLRGGKR